MVCCMDEGPEPEGEGIMCEGEMNALDACESDECAHDNEWIEGSEADAIYNGCMEDSHVENECDFASCLNA